MPWLTWGPFWKQRLWKGPPNETGLETIVVTPHTRSPSLFPHITKEVSICMLSCSVVSDSETPQTVARQALLSMEFSRQE